jgi:hypothetical protein
MRDITRINFLFGVTNFMQSNERLIQYFDLTLYARTRAKDINHVLVSPRSLDELMNDFHQLREMNLARKRLSSQSRLEFRLEDMEELPDSWVLLVNVVDAAAAHPVTQLIGGSDDDREVVTLGHGRGLESSTHLILYKARDAAGKHLILCEKSSNLPFAKASSFLNHLCKVASKKVDDVYKLPHPDGVDGKTINAYCVVTFLGHPSDSFREELEEGKITDISLTSDARIIRGYDAQAHQELVSTEIKMKVSRIDVALSGGNWGHLQKAIQYGNDLGTHLVRVRFSDSSGSGHSATLDINTALLQDADRYVKKRMISGFNHSLRTAFSNIHDGIRDKMLELEDDNHV